MIALPNAKRRPGAGGGAGQKFRDDRLTALYLTIDGRAIAPLAVIIKNEIGRRVDSAARAVKAVRHG